MPWVRIDENFPHHPKVMAAGPLGLAMQVAALCYCNRYLTDGFIPKAVVPTLLNFDGLAVRVRHGELVGDGKDATWELVVEDLLRAGLWEEVEGGYRIHDYLDYQPSRTEVLAEREAAKERMARRRKRSQEVHEKFARTSEEVRENFPRTSDEVPEKFNFPDPVPILERRGEERRGEEDTRAHAREDASELLDWRRWYEQHFVSVPPERWRLRIDEKIARGMHPALVIRALEAALGAKAEHPLSWADSKLATWYARGIRSPDDLKKIASEGTPSSPEQRSRHPPVDDQSRNPIYRDMTEEAWQEALEAGLVDDGGDEL